MALSCLEPGASVMRRAFYLVTRAGCIFCVEARGGVPFPLPRKRPAEQDFGIVADGAIRATHDIAAAQLVQNTAVGAQHAWLIYTLTNLVNRWPASRINDLMPWAYAKTDPARQCAVGTPLTNDLVASAWSRVRLC